MSNEKPDNRVTHGISTRDPINLCEGYEDELTGIMTQLVGKNKVPLTQEQQDELLIRAEFLNRELDERNRRLDQPSGPIWRGM